MKDVIKTQHHVQEVKTIHGRKVEVNRRKRRNNMKGYYALAFVFAGIILAALCLTVFFNIDKIQVEGVTLYRNDQILAVGGVSKGDNLVRTDTDIIKERLEKTLVYLDEVQVEKAYPSGIVIKCTEAEKSADILCDDTYYVLSYSGKILETKNGRPTGNIPVVKGFDLTSKNVGDALASEDEYKAEVLNNLLQNMKDCGFENIVEIDISYRSDIVLNYDNKIEIKLGSSADMEYKLSYLKAVIDNKLAKSFEGTLVYNGAESGISAIPKSSSSVSASSSESSDESSLAENSENTEDTTDTQYDDSQTTGENGYSEQDTVYDAYGNQTYEQPTYTTETTYNNYGY